MPRLLRIVVLVMAVMPLLMLPTMRMARWAASGQCVAQATVDHACCPGRAAIAAPACCNARTDSAVAEGKAAVDEARLSAGSRIPPITLSRTRYDARGSREFSGLYISILVPALILRT